MELEQTACVLALLRSKGIMKIECWVYWSTISPDTLYISRGKTCFWNLSSLLQSSAANGFGPDLISQHTCTMVFQSHNLSKKSSMRLKIAVLGNHKRKPLVGCFTTRIYQHHQPYMKIPGMKTPQISEGKQLSSQILMRRNLLQSPSASACWEARATFGVAWDDTLLLVSPNK